ncbi:MAG TPA: hypothetical protein VLK33_15165 [Terriglobales bacterium]|nr:hypothetical protein [Terriglobales bacterium]
MEIKPHLNESELTEFISNPSRGLGTHLEICDTCLSEVASLRENTAGIKAITERPQEFWDQQRTAIRNRIAALPARSRPISGKLAWVPVCALVILAGLLLTGGSPAPPPSVAPQASVDPDHELLLAVEQVMDSNGPDALEPATYFIEQISQSSNTNARTKIRNQERLNAN